MGDYLMDGLKALEKKYEIIGDVRGKGLFCGLELVKNRDTKEPRFRSRGRSGRGRMHEAGRDHRQDQPLLPRAEQHSLPCPGTDRHHERARRSAEGFGQGFSGRKSVRDSKLCSSRSGNTNQFQKPSRAVRGAGRHRKTETSRKDASASGMPVLEQRQSPPTSRLFCGCPCEAQLHGQ